MNLFELFVKIGVDDQASGKLSDLSSKLGNGLKTAAKIGTAAVGAAAAGITALTKSAVDNYAEYEQLVGGVETLFKNSADTVVGYAENAYKTAGLSANEYMSTVTSFSASLLQSLGGDTEAAAKYADTAVTDMADNANKLGTSIDMLQNAYSGFAKQNFTMLDNLKLGYGGTKEEMQRLLEHAETLPDALGKDFDISNYADIVEAIHLVQEEMGIAGATALEAGTTIEGSVNSMKGAWANLVTGLGDANADIDVLLDNFLDSVETMGKNLFPVVKRILAGLFTTLEERGPDMIAEGVLLLGKLAVGLITGTPDLIRKIPEIIKKIVSAFTERSPEFKGIGKSIVQGIWDGLSSMGKWLGNKVDSFFDGIVGGVKDFLGIHSPSRVFAGIGENMAQGLGEGWEDEFGSIKKGIENGIDFGVANIDVGASMLGRNSNALNSAFSNFAANLEQNATIVVQSVLDGRVIGETAYKYSKNRERAYGGA